MKSASVLSVVLVLGCAGPEPAPPDEAGTTGLTLNGHAMHDLAAYPLVAQSLEEVESLSAVMREPIVQFIMRYIVTCALPEGDTLDLEVDGQALHYEGDMGLAPEWRDGPCEEACQEWVSACIMSRTNAYGVPVLLVLRGTNPALVPEEGPEEAFTIEEGAFWGNAFVQPARQYVCSGRDYDPWYLTFRVCTREGSPCLFDYVGTCDLVDGETGGPSDRKACEEFDPTLGGIYRRCHDRPSDLGGETFPESQVWDRVITTYLKDARF